jgi:hypothetical protein
MERKGKNARHSKEGGWKMQKGKNVIRKPGKTDHVRAWRVRNLM